MTASRHGSCVVTYPNELTIAVTRDFDAPIALVFDVLLKEEHMRKTIAPFGEEVTVCSVDLRVGGEYRYVFVTDDGKECAFFGTFREIVPPTRSVQTWHFGGWPGVEAIESFDLSETDGVTTMTWTIEFADQAGRAHMTKHDGIEANFDNVARYLETLQADQA